jgi:hypothetical protein
MSDLALVGERAMTAKESLRMSLENVVPLINPKTDFASIKGKIEPTRDLILKLIDPFNLSFDTELKSKEVDGEVRRYTFKATITGPDGRTVTGWGQCGTDEVSDGGRADHDAMTKAETRALKRGVEAKAGFGMVNQLIMHFFGGYQEPTNVTPEDTDGRKAILARFSALGDSLTEDEKAIIKKTTHTLNDAELEAYVARWEKKVAKMPRGAGVPDEKIPL